jgi:DNA-binding MarR family transcriptional regulator
MSITAHGQQILRDRRAQSTERLARALAAGFTEGELDQLAAVVPLLERLAQGI